MNAIIQGHWNSYPSSPELSERAHESRPPKAWLVLGQRTGENAQIIALAEALGWPFEIKRLVYRKYEFVTNVLRGTGLAGINKRQSSPLLPPWPDLVISAGMRGEPVCRWIRKQAGGRVKLIHIGRPWARPEHFDLVITTPQYRLPAHPNVLHNKLTLYRVTEARLAAAAAKWTPHFAQLPRPYIAVIIGGNSGPYVFDRLAAERLGREASAMADGSGGSLLITTSARTPATATAALATTLHCPHHLFRWTPNTADNPYFGYLALADAIIVTGDSVAMLTEACATRKPVYIFDLSQDSTLRKRAISAYNKGDRLRRQWQYWEFSHLQAFIYRQTMQNGPQRLTRDVSSIHQFLITSGRAVWLGQHLSPALPPPPLEDMQRAVDRVRALFTSATNHQQPAKYNATLLSR